MSTDYVMFYEVMPINEHEKEFVEWIIGDGRGRVDIEDRAALDIFCTAFHVEDPEDWPGFDTWIVEGKWVLESDEGGNPDNAARALQMFLKVCRPDECARLEVSYSSLHTGPGEFGGAAYFITKDEIEVIGTGPWLSEKVEKWNERESEDEK